MSWGELFVGPQVVTSHLYNEAAQGGLGMETLGDSLASGADDCDSMLQEVVDTNPQLKQEVEKVHARARVSQAWLALRAARSQAADLKKKGELHDDLDAMLPKDEMDDLEDRFWARYKLQFSAENTPADMLVSRLAKEISKRLFQVKNIWAVKTLVHQVRTSRKKRKITEDVQLLVADDIDDEDVAETVETYLQLLFVYCVGLAKAGCNPIAGAPKEEKRGMDTTLHVDVPFDVVMAYHARAVHRAGLLPPRRALVWLVKKDLEERTLWVSTFRSSRASLGSIIKELMERREAMWEVEKPPESPEVQTPPSNKGRPQITWDEEEPPK